MKGRDRDRDKDMGVILYKVGVITQINPFGYALEFCKTFVILEFTSYP
jgi:hypothetical protein